jgi:Secretion system C-terminal sorting domain
LLFSIFNLNITSIHLIQFIMKQLLQFSRKIFLLVCISCLYLITIHTNAQTTTWVKPFKPNSSTNSVTVADVGTDGSGNVYTVGSFKGTVNFNYGGVATNLTSAGGFDVFITKHNSAGILQWAHRIGNTADDEAAAIGIGNNAVVVGGTFKSINMDFDPGAGVVPLSSAGGSDLFVLNLTGAGVYTWAKRAGGTADELLSDIDINTSSSGNGVIYIGGSFSSGIMDFFDPSTNTGSHGGYDAFICALSSTGAYKWVNAIGGAGNDIGHKVTNDGINSVMICCDILAASTTFDPGSGFNTGTFSGVTSNGIVSSFDLSLAGGSFEGFHQFKGTSNAIAAYIFSGKIRVLGSFTGLMDIDPSATVQNIAPTGSRDMFIVDVNKPNGTNTYYAHIQGKGTTSTSQINVSDIARSNNANDFLVCGYVVGSADLGGTSAAEVAALGTSEQGFIIKYNNVLNSTTFAIDYVYENAVAQTGNDNSRTNCLVEDNANNLILGGSYSSTSTLPNPTIFNPGNLSGLVADPLFQNASMGYLQYIANCTAVTPTIAITSSQTTICAGTNITFTATPTNGGTTPIYQWKVNGTNVGTNTTTYSSSTLTNGASVTCVLTSNVACATTTNATSNALAISVNAAVTPAVAITASQTTICAGTNITFSATPTNGGATPIYQWKRNGTNVGTNSATYSSNALTNGASVTCVLTSNAACATTTNATSNAVAISVNAAVTPAVSIAASQTTICSGTNVTFSATPTNGGTTPIYQWKVNGTNVGTNASTYSSSTLTNGANVTCVITSNAACATSPNATSNSSVITVTNPATPTITINASQTSICSGVTVVFTSNASNGGTTPIYQWKINGSNVGTNSNSYSSNALANNDVVTCQLTSNANCISTSNVISNSITMSTSTAVPSISISAGQASFCAGTLAQYNATAINGGSSPSYIWKVNGVNAGTNASFTSSTLANGDIITCDLTSNAACVNPSTASSLPINAVITPSLIPSLVITGSQTSVCDGTEIIFTATPNNGGTNPIYQWQVNGSNVGTNTTSYASSALTNGASITCILTSDATCASPSNATSNPVSITVNPIPNTNVSIVNETLTADQAGATYQWLDCSNAFAPIPSANTQSYLATSNGSYAVLVDLGGCIDTSACQTISSVGLLKLNQKIYFNVYPNPTHAYLYISNPSTEKINIQLLDATGKIIYTKHTSENLLKIEMNEIKSGLYIVKINSKNHIYTQRIVRE